MSRSTDVFGASIIGSSGPHYTDKLCPHQKDPPVKSRFFQTVYRDLVRIASRAMQNAATPVGALKLFKDMQDTFDVLVDMDSTETENSFLSFVVNTLGCMESGPNFALQSHKFNLAVGIQSSIAHKLKVIKEHGVEHDHGRTPVTQPSASPATPETTAPSSSAHASQPKSADGVPSPANFPCGCFTITRFSDSPMEDTPMPDAVLCEVKAKRDSARDSAVPTTHWGPDKDVVNSSFSIGDTTMVDATSLSGDQFIPRGTDSASIPKLDRNDAPKQPSEVDSNLRAVHNHTPSAAVMAPPIAASSLQLGPVFQTGDTLMTDVGKMGNPTATSTGAKPSPDGHSLKSSGNRGPISDLTLSDISKPTDLRNRKEAIMCPGRGAPKLTRTSVESGVNIGPEVSLVATQAPGCGVPKLTRASMESGVNIDPDFSLVMTQGPGRVVPKLTRTSVGCGINIDPDVSLVANLDLPPGSRDRKRRRLSQENSRVDIIGEQFFDCETPEDNDRKNAGTPGDSSDAAPKGSSTGGTAMSVANGIPQEGNSENVVCIPQRGNSEKVVGSQRLLPGASQEKTEVERPPTRGSNASGKQDKWLPTGAEPGKDEVKFWPKDPSATNSTKRRFKCGIQGCDFVTTNSNHKTAIISHLRDCHPELNSFLFPRFKYNSPHCCGFEKCEVPPREKIQPKTDKSDYTILICLTPEQVATADFPHCDFKCKKECGAIFTSSGECVRHEQACSASGASQYYCSGCRAPIPGDEQHAKEAFREHQKHQHPDAAILIHHDREFDEIQNPSGETRIGVIKALERALFGNIPEKESGVFRIVSHNCASVLPKAEILSDFCNKIKADWVSGQESWLRKNDVSDVNMADFAEASRSDREDGYAGVVSFAAQGEDSDWSWVDSSACVTTGCGQCTSNHVYHEDALNYKPIQILNLYSDPRASFADNDLPVVKPFADGDCGVTAGTAERIVLSDINAHDPAWEKRATVNARGKAWKNWFNTHGVEPVNKSSVSTRPSSNTSPDVTAVSSGIRVKNWIVGNRLLSEHLPIILDVWWPTTDDCVLVDDKDPSEAVAGAGQQAKKAAKAKKSRARKKAKKNAGKRVVKNFYRKADFGEFRNRLNLFMSFTLVALALSNFCVGFASRFADNLAGEKIPPEFPRWIANRGAETIRKSVGVAPTSPAPGELQDSPESIDNSERVLREAIIFASKSTIPRGAVKKRKRYLAHPSQLGPEMIRSIALRNALLDKGLVKEAVPVRRKIANHLNTLRSKRFDDAFNKVDWSEAGLPTAFRFIDFVESGRWEPEPETVLLHNKKVLFGREQKAEAFNEHYCNGHPRIAEERAIQLRENYLPILGEASCPSVVVTRHEIEHALRKLSNGSAGPDKIDAVQVKNLPRVGRDLLRSVVQSTIRIGYVPKRWRSGVTVPVPKPGKKKHLIPSFRPITLTNIVTKIAERIVIGRILRHLGFDPAQFGYTPKRAAHDELGVFIADTQAALRAGKTTVAIFIDMTAAFDRVPHEILLGELVERGNLVPAESRDEYLAYVRWLESFLSDRENAVRVGDHTSSFLPIKQGVPQGTISGPACWKVFIDSLLTILRTSGANFLCYADDIVIYESTDSPDEATKTLQSHLDTVTVWAAANNMQISASKTVYTVFSHCYPNKVDLSVCGVAIPSEDFPKLLGVTFDRGLTMERHLKITIARCRRRLSAVRVLSRASWKPACSQVRQLYRAMVESVFMYAAAVWMPCLSDAGLKQIDDLQYHAAKLILGVPGWSQKAATISDAGLFPAKELAAREAAFLCCRGYMRAEEGDPLKRVVRKAGASWTQLGRQGMRNAGILGALLEKEHLPVFDSGIDIWDDIYEGRLELTEEECEESDIHWYHENFDSVWYTDGSVVHGRGAAGLIRFDKGGAEPALSKGIPLTLVCDSFTAEQLALLECTSAILEDRHAPSQIVILTDSLSNVMSLHSAGVRDRREDQIMRNLRMICSRGTRVEIRFVRGHNGCRGNLLADAACSEITEKVEFFRSDRPLPEHVAKTYCNAICKERALSSLNLQREDSGTVGHLYDATAFESNKVLDRAGDYGACRLAEIAYNQMRLGLDVFSRGFCWGVDAEEKDKCPHCRGMGAGVRHILFDCVALESQRVRLKCGIEAEREERMEEHREKIKRLATEKGRDPVAALERDDFDLPTWGNLGVVGAYPGPLLKFISECDFWVHSWKSL